VKTKHLAWVLRASVPPNGTLHDVRNFGIRVYFCDRFVGSVVLLLTNLSAAELMQ
jgi:hypothetical protein